MKNVVVAGGSGLVGKALLKQLSRIDDLNVTALVRREGALAKYPFVKEWVFDFDNPADYAKIGTEIPCDVLYLCLGTTCCKARSKREYLKVERDYPMTFVDRLKQLEPKPTVAFISAAGAQFAKGCYLKAKAEVEEYIRSSGVPHLIVRPSLLMGEREEIRPLEIVATKVIAPLYLRIMELFGGVSGKMATFAPIRASQLARALTYYTLHRPDHGETLEGQRLFHFHMS